MVECYPLLTPQQMNFAPSPELMAVYHDLQARNLISVRVRLDRLRSPNPTPSTYYRSMLLISLEQPERARPLVDSLSTSPDSRLPYLHANATLQLSLGKRALQGKEISKAFSLLRQAMSNHSFPQFDQEIGKIVLETIQNPRFRYNLVEQMEALNQCLRIVPNSPAVIRQAIQIYMNNSSYSEALRLAKALASLEPIKENLVSLLEIANLTGMPQEIEMATSFINQKLPGQRVEFITNPSISLSNPNPDNRIKILIQQGRIEEARQHLENLRSQFPDDLDLLIEHVKLLKRLGEHRSAMVLLLNNESRFQNQLPYLLEKISIQAITDSTQALAELESLLDSGSLYGLERTEAEILRARIYLEYRDSDVALQLLETLIQNSPGPNDELHFLLGAAHLKGQYFNLAEASFFEAHRIAPQKPHYILALANVTRLFGSNKRAAQWAKKLTLTHPESMEAQKAHNILNSSAASKIGTISPSIQALAPSFTTSNLPDLLRIHLWLDDPENSLENPLHMFSILESQRHWETLILKMEEFLTHNQVYPELEAKLEELYQKYGGLPQKSRVPVQPYAQIASTWCSSGYEDEAIEFFHFLNHLPEFPIQLKLAFIPALMNKRQLNLCEEILREALLNDIETLKNYSQLAYIYFLRKDFSTALEIYGQILSLEPGNTEVLFKSAEVQRAMGNPDKAKEIYESILETSQDSAAIRDAKFYLRSLNPDQG